MFVEMECTETDIPWKVAARWSCIVKRSIFSK